MVYNFAGAVSRALAGKQIFTDIIFRNPLGKGYPMFDLDGYDSGKLVYKSNSDSAVVLHPRISLSMCLGDRPVMGGIPARKVAQGLNIFKKEIVENIDPKVVERLHVITGNLGSDSMGSINYFSGSNPQYSEDLYEQLRETANRLFGP